MKKVAVTVAVLALGLAACQPKAEENAAANETAVENNAEYDVNAASNDASAVADNTLNAAGNAIENAGNAVENAGNAVSNAAENATH
jgi:predicted small secreted protein